MSLSDPAASLPRRVVVTGGDHGYAHLIDELLASIRLFRSAAELGIAILDGGLTDDDRTRFRSLYGARILQTTWEYKLAAWKVRGREHLKIQLSRAFLDRYLPEADLIAWIDADAWVQDIAGVDLLFEVAESGRLAIVCEASRHAEHVIRVRWRAFGLAEIRSILYKNARKARVPERQARQIGLKPTLNSGVFALRRDSPLWEGWRQRQAYVLKRGARIFSSDQLSLALAVYLDGADFELLPDSCNYLGPWKVARDGSALVEAYAPNTPISIVHLAGQKTQRATQLEAIHLPQVGGGEVETTLRFPSWRDKIAARLATR